MPRRFGEAEKEAQVFSGTVRSQNSEGGANMKRTKTILLTAAALLLAVSSVLGQEAVVSRGVTRQMSNFAGSGQVQPPVRHGFGFDSSDVSGFPNRSASLTGGGAYDLAGF